MTALPPASPHGELTEVLPDVFFVTGGVRMAPLLSFSRNMVVVRQGERLVLVNSMRLHDTGLAALDELGTVTDVIRLAGFHGMDDPFYKERYGAKTWVVDGMTYHRGFDATKPGATPYFEADATMGPDTAGPRRPSRRWRRCGRSSSSRSSTCCPPTAIRWWAGPRSGIGG